MGPCFGPGTSSDGEERHPADSDKATVEPVAWEPSAHGEPGADGDGDARDDEADSGRNGQRSNHDSLVARQTRSTFVSPHTTCCRVALESLAEASVGCRILNEAAKSLGETRWIELEYPPIDMHEIPP